MSFKYFSPQLFRMNQALKQNTLHQQLLQHMIEQQDLDIYDLMLANEQVNKNKLIKSVSIKTYTKLKE